MSAKLVGKAFNILIKLKELQKDKDLSGKVQFYIDRLNDMIKNPDAHVDNDTLFTSFGLIKDLIKLHPDQSIDIEYF